jgi:hypothetical protein
MAEVSAGGWGRRCPHRVRWCCFAAGAPPAGAAGWRVGWRARRGSGLNPPPAPRHKRAARGAGSGCRGGCAGGALGALSTGRRSHPPGRSPAGRPSRHRSHRDRCGWKACEGRRCVKDSTRKTAAARQAACAQPPQQGMFKKKAWIRASRLNQRSRHSPAAAAAATEATAVALAAAAKAALATVALLQGGGRGGAQVVSEGWGTLGGTAAGKPCFAQLWRAKPCAPFMSGCSTHLVVLAAGGALRGSAVGAGHVDGLKRGRAGGAENGWTRGRHAC